MNEGKKELPNILDMFRIGYKKKTPEQLKYARFSRRLHAFTIDTVLIMLLVAPFVNAVFESFYGAFPLDMNEFMQTVRQLPTRDEQYNFAMERMRETGAIDYRINSIIYQFGVMILLSALCWYRWGATPGKLIMHIRVVDAKTEGRISLNQALLRGAGFVISGTTFLLGFFWIGLDKRKQSWHDKLAETVVITVPFRKKAKSAT